MVYCGIMTDDNNFVIESRVGSPKSGSGLGTKRLGVGVVGMK